VAEQLVLEDLLRERGAVEREERPLGAVALAVDGVGDELLAVPLSPRISTDAVLAATRSIIW
jgi:hypothetical protein